MSSMEAEDKPTADPGAAGSSTDNSAFQQAAKFYQAGRKNLVWQKLAEAENLKETEVQMDAVTLIDKFVITRGPETYVVGNKRKRKLPDDFMKESEMDTDNQTSGPGTSDGTGTSESAKRHKPMYPADETGTDELTGQKLLEERIAAMDDKILPNFCARILKEKREKWYLFVRAFNAFGREEFIRLFKETLDTERAGGLLTKNQSRRRTAGGVFLHLARTDEKLSQEDRDAVFSYDKQQAIEEKLTNKTFQKRKMLESMAAKLREDAQQNNKQGVEFPTKDSEVEDAEDDDHSYPITAGAAQTTAIQTGMATGSTATAASVPRGRKLIEYSDIDGLESNPFDGTLTSKVQFTMLNTSSVN